jgi:hypothetical protein
MGAGRSKRPSKPPAARRSRRKPLDRGREFSASSPADSALPQPVNQREIAQRSDPNADENIAAGGGLRAAMEALDEQIAFVAAQLDRKRALGEIDTTLGSNLAWMGEKRAAMSREIRQLETHERTAAEAMTDEEADALVVAHVLDLPVERRARVIERMVAGAMSSDRRVL